MAVNFDIQEFCQSLKSSKPPYKCPLSDCNKKYQSICGIQFHLLNCHKPPARTPKCSSGRKKGSRKQGKKRRTLLVADQLPVQPTYILTNAEAQNFVSFDVDGTTERVSVFADIPVVSVEEAIPSSSSAATNPSKPDHAKGSSSEKQTKGSACEQMKSNRRDQVEEQKQAKLPLPQFSLISDYNIEDAPPMPSSYIRFIERSPEELDKEIEYDMDEEDVAWLNIMNTKRKLENLADATQDDFELLMDRLEKESYFQSITLMQNSGQVQVPLIDDDAVCCICMDGECQNSNVILFCDMCNLAVHQECYGVPYIPEGQWLCRRCIQSPSRAVDCSLCPNKGGAFKQTDDGRWAHVVCALWIPEVSFANTVFLEPIDNIDNIPPARWKLTCYICKQRGVGACIQCHKTNCYIAFHVTCAQQASLHMKMDSVQEVQGGFQSFTVKKTAYCDSHTPPDSDVRPQLDNGTQKCTKDKVHQKQKQKARKSAEKRSSVPVISIPTIPPDRVQKIAALVSLPKKNQFLQRLMAYWTLKRRARNGVPLLRRLQASQLPRREDKVNQDESINGTAEDHTSPKSNIRKDDDVLEQLKYWQRLRQDLERVRLLCELVRKREKTKREVVKIREHELCLQLRPLQHFLRSVVELIEFKDPTGIFAEPVDIEEVPDYLTVVKEPMDLSTMKEKIESFLYTSVEDLEADFHLMIENCLTYNAKDTIFYRAAVRLRDNGEKIIRQAKKEEMLVGFDNNSGLMLRDPGSVLLEGQEIMDEVQSVIDDPSRTTMPYTQHMHLLMDILRKVQTSKHGPFKTKKTHLIKSEIYKLQGKRGKNIEKQKEADNQAPAQSSMPSCSNKVVNAETTAMNQDISDRGEDNNESTDKTEVAVNVEEDQGSIETNEDSLDSEQSVPKGVDGICDRGKEVHRSSEKTEDAENNEEGLENNGVAVNSEQLVSKASSDDICDQGEDESEVSEILISSSSDKDHCNKKVSSHSESVVLPDSGSDNKAISKSDSNTNEVKSTSQEIAGKSGSMAVNGHESISMELSQGNGPRTDSGERSSSVLMVNPIRISFGRDEPNEQNNKTGLSRTSRRSQSEMEVSSTTSVFKEPDQQLEGSATTTVSVEPSEVQAALGSTTGVNRRTAVLFKKKAAGGFSKPVRPKVFTKRSKGRSRKKAENASTSSSQSDSPMLVRKRRRFSDSSSTHPSSTALPAQTSTTTNDPKTPELPSSGDSFKVYRSKKEIPQWTDDETHSESESSTSLTSDTETSSHAGELTGDSTSTSSGDEGSYNPHNKIPLEPLDLVWAKCRGYPWYPALIINPKMPKTGYFHNGVPIPAPPDDVLALSDNYKEPVFLVLFFDTKRTWQWLPRQKLEPLGVDSGLDKYRLVESCKPAKRKAVKKAYEEAIFHRCIVTGENTGFGDSGSEDNA